MAKTDPSAVESEATEVSSRAYIAKVTGILSIIFAFTAPVAGVVLGVIGILTHGRKDGTRNTPAIFGLVLSLLVMVITTIVMIALAMTFIQNIDSLTETCQEQGAGRHRIGTFTSVTCGNDGRILDVDL